MISIRRALVATAGLVLIGMVVGAFCGAVSIATIAVVTGEWRDALRPGLWLTGGTFGAMIGSVAAPLLTWLCLRHVPLGRAVAYTAIGTIAGALLGAAFPAFPAGLLFGPILGFAAAGVVLATTTPRHPLHRLPGPHRP